MAWKDDKKSGNPGIHTVSSHEACVLGGSEPAWMSRSVPTIAGGGSVVRLCLTHATNSGGLKARRRPCARSRCEPSAAAAAHEAVRDMWPREGRGLRPVWRAIRRDHCHNRYWGYINGRPPAHQRMQESPGNLRPARPARAATDKGSRTASPNTAEGATLVLRGMCSESRASPCDTRVVGCSSASPSRAVIGPLAVGRD